MYTLRKILKPQKKYHLLEALQSTIEYKYARRFFKVLIVFFCYLMQYYEQPLSDFWQDYDFSVLQGQFKNLDAQKWEDPNFWLGPRALKNRSPAKNRLKTVHNIVLGP